VPRTGKLLAGDSSANCLSPLRQTPERQELDRRAPRFPAGQAARHQRSCPPGRGSPHPPRGSAAASAAGLRFPGTSASAPRWIRVRGPTSVWLQRMVTRWRPAALAENIRGKGPAFPGSDGMEPSFLCRIANRSSAFRSCRRNALDYRLRPWLPACFCSSCNA